MSTLQMEFMQTIEGISDDAMRLLLEVVKQIVVPLDHNGKIEEILSMQQKKPRKMGSLKGQKLISDGYDIDECNDEIAKMFGGNHK